MNWGIGLGERSRRRFSERHDDVGNRLLTPLPPLELLQAVGATLRGKSSLFDASIPAQRVGESLQQA